MALMGGLAVLAAAAHAQESPPPAQATPTPAAAAPSSPDPSPDRISRLEAQLERLEKALAEERAERRQEREAMRREVQAAADEAAKRVVKSTPGAAERKLQFRLAGFVQADAVAYRQDSVDEVDPSTGEPLNETRFVIRRARLDGEIDYGLVGGALRFEGNTVSGPTARIIGAEVWLRWAPRDRTRPPYLAVALGILKIPFVLEVPQYNADRLFLERTNMSRALFPGDFDLGARLHGGWRFLRYAVAAMNGNPVGERGYPGRDPNESKDLLGRLGIETAAGRHAAVAAGFSGLYGTGFHRGTPATKDVLTWRDTNGDGLIQLSELVAIQGSAGTPSQNFRRFALGLDARVAAAIPRLGQLVLYGEIIWAANLDRGLLVADPVAAGRELREFGGYVALTQELGRFAAVGVRYDRYNPDADASEQLGDDRVPRDSSSSTLAVAFAVRYPPWARLVVEYDRNTNALGRTLSGQATTLGSDAVTVRAQVAF